MKELVKYNDIENFYLEKKYFISFIFTCIILVNQSLKKSLMTSTDYGVLFFIQGHPAMVQCSCDARRLNSLMGFFFSR